MSRRVRRFQFLVATGALLALGLWAGAQPSSVVSSPHNLSASGPGAIHAASEQEICIFCHAPHNAAPVRPLWNRATPTEGYTIYTSRSLEAHPGQPTGASKMCLSCHDGTIALGSVLSRNTPIMMAGGLTSIQGAGRIGTDLADDHPISFRFDTSLANKDPKIKSPGSLPAQVRLDANSELQCTSCHDAHNNSLGNFLVMANDHSQLCTTCHQVGHTTITAHDNCSACHVPHSSPSGPYLLRRQTVSQTCLACHDGSVARAANIAAELRKGSVHDTNSPVNLRSQSTDQVGCTDCHEPHTMLAAPPNAPLLARSATPSVPVSLGRISGMSSSGVRNIAAASEFEVCFKCHSGAQGGIQHRAWVSRRWQVPDMRLVFSPSAVSFHPVEASGRNPIVPSLRPGFTPASRLACTSCHNSNTGKAAGSSGPDGPHGSTNAPLLVARYRVDDYTTESAQAYALCYMCHDRTNILANKSFPLHSLHIVDVRTPCSACHDAHGISSTVGSIRGNSNLINFANAIVFPDRVTGKLEFRDTGVNRGECFLSCHGSNHSPKRYP